MLLAGKLHPSNASITAVYGHSFSRIPHSYCIPYRLRLSTPPPRFPSLAALSHSASTVATTAEKELETSGSSNYIATVGSPASPSLLQLPQWNLTQRHILVLNVIAGMVAVSATWLFLSAIPAMLAFKRAAESLEKLMDVTREELPDTMAAIRLSGMEISDLTMELSDLGQEITQGVRSSTKAVRVAEERLRGLASMAPTASLQRVRSPITEPQGGLAVARSAREMKDRIVKGRAIFQTFLTLLRFSRMTLNYFAKRAKR